MESRLKELEDFFQDEQRILLGCLWAGSGIGRYGPVVFQEALPGTETTVKTLQSSLDWALVDLIGSRPAPAENKVNEHVEHRSLHAVIKKEGL